MRSATMRRGADAALAQVGLSVLVSLLAVAAFVRVGPATVLFILVLLAAVIAAIASPTGFAIAVVALAPLPDVGQIVGIQMPLGLDPLDVLVVLGCGILAQRAGAALKWPRPLVALTAVNLGLLVFAWYRTYGSDATSSASLGLLVKPAIVVVAAWVVIRLLPPHSVLPVLAYSMGCVILVVSASVVLQWLGLYTTAHQVEYATQLGIKQWGGVMLDANTAGAFVAIFSVPTFLLLRAAGGARLGFVVAVASVPVLLITLARGSIVGFGSSLLALAILDRRRAGGLKVAISLGALGAIWAATGGREQVTFIVDNLTRTAGDQNAALSGRLAIWNVAQQYLDDRGRWIFGGGLDAFKAYANAGELQHGFATHNTFLLLMTTGGVIMLAAVIAIVIALWRVAGRCSEPAIGIALKVALLTAAVVGLSIDVDLFSRRMAWIWILAAAAARYARTDEHADTNRSDIAPTPHAVRGAAIAHRTSRDPSAST